MFVCGVWKWGVFMYFWENFVEIIKGNVINIVIGCSVYCVLFLCFCCWCYCFSFLFGMGFINLVWNVKFLRVNIYYNYNVFLCLIIK